MGDNEEPEEVIKDLLNSVVDEVENEPTVVENLRNRQTDYIGQGINHIELSVTSAGHMVHSSEGTSADATESRESKTMNKEDSDHDDRSPTMPMEVERTITFFTAKGGETTRTVKSVVSPGRLIRKSLTQNHGHNFEKSPKTPPRYFNFDGDRTARYNAEQVKFEQAMDELTSLQRSPNVRRPMNWDTSCDYVPLQQLPGRCNASTTGIANGNALMQLLTGPNSSVYESSPGRSGLQNALARRPEQRQTQSKAAKVRTSSDGHGSKASQDNKASQSSSTGSSDGDRHGQSVRDKYRQYPFRRDSEKSRSRPSRLPMPVKPGTKGKPCALEWHHGRNSIKTGATLPNGQHDKYCICSQCRGGNNCVQWPGSLPLERVDTIVGIDGLLDTWNCVRTTRNGAETALELNPLGQKTLREIFDDQIDQFSEEIGELLLQTIGLFARSKDNNLVHLDVIGRLIEKLDRTHSVKLAEMVVKLVKEQPDQYSLIRVKPSNGRFIELCGAHIPPVAKIRYIEIALKVGSKLIVVYSDLRMPGFQGTFAHGTSKVRIYGTYFAFATISNPNARCAANILFNALPNDAQEALWNADFTERVLDWDRHTGQWKRVVAMPAELEQIGNWKRELAKGTQSARLLADVTWKMGPDTALNLFDGNFLLNSEPEMVTRFNVNSQAKLEFLRMFNGNRNDWPVYKGGKPEAYATEGERAKYYYKQLVAVCQWTSDNRFPMTTSAQSTWIGTMFDAMDQAKPGLRLGHCLKELWHWFRQGTDFKHSFIGLVPNN